MTRKYDISFFEKGEWGKIELFEKKFELGKKSKRIGFMGFYELKKVFINNKNHSDGKLIFSIRTYIMFICFLFFLQI